jgi:pimeloyl-ACP methyl ester carboxylesterase
MTHLRTDSDFHSQGTRCAGWLYLPEGVTEPPVVIMAHGFAAERTFRLPAYAERFVDRGLAVLLFDYRNFGASDGEPRNLVSPRRHVQDWHAAIAHVRGLPNVRTGKIALWGSSFSGGHVTVVAARDGGIAAIVSQIPFVDGLSTLDTLGLQYTLKALTAGFRDLGRALTFRAPYYVPVVEDPERFGIMNRPDSKPGYLAIVPEESSWRNECPARIVLAASFYRPLSFAGRVTCPAFVLLAEKDTLIPARTVERLAARMPRAELVRVPLGHFDVYVGDAFEETANLEADFLERHLLGKDKTERHDPPET